MSTITTVNNGDSGLVARTSINDNFANLNTDKIEVASTDTLTNKSIDFTANTIVMTVAQLNTAISDGVIATGGGTATGTNTGDQVISDATISTTDITTNDVSTSKHGFAPKGSGVVTEFLNGNGVYSVPPSGGTNEWTKIGTKTFTTGSAAAQTQTVTGASNKIFKVDYYFEVGTGAGVGFKIGLTHSGATTITAYGRQYFNGATTVLGGTVPIGWEVFSSTASNARDIQGQFRTSGATQDGFMCDNQVGGFSGDLKMIYGHVNNNLGVVTLTGLVFTPNAAMNMKATIYEKTLS